MKLKVGQTLKNAVDSTALVLVRCPDEDLALTCGGHEMAPQDQLGERVAPADGAVGGGGSLLLLVFCWRPPAKAEAS
ncbi:hypothetical protein ABGB12_32370 [Actinocorallia sp. B10E7]|uniref:hypothetical protein n=1 Tax=Actinocorallia sp. B10E7 TaxID=3153558 RepID=UPI00325CF176